MWAKSFMHKRLLRFGLWVIIILPGLRTHKGASSIVHVLAANKRLSKHCRSLLISKTVISLSLTHALRCSLNSRGILIRWWSRRVGYLRSIDWSILDSLNIIVEPLFDFLNLYLLESLVISQGYTIEHFSQAVIKDLFDFMRFIVLFVEFELPFKFLNNRITLIQIIEMIVRHHFWWKYGAWESRSEGSSWWNISSVGSSIRPRRTKGWFWIIIWWTSTTAWISSCAHLIFYFWHTYYKRSRCFILFI